jgi:hypothetical protein
MEKIYIVIKNNIINRRTEILSVNKSLTGAYNYIEKFINNEVSLESFDKLIDKENEQPIICFLIKSQEFINILIYLVQS